MANKLIKIKAAESAEQRWTRDADGHPAHWKGHRYDEDGNCICGAQIEDTWFVTEQEEDGE